MINLKSTLDSILESAERCPFVDEPIVKLQFRHRRSVLVVEIDPRLKGVEATLTQPPNITRTGYTLDDVDDFLKELGGS